MSSKKTYISRAGSKCASVSRLAAANISELMTERGVTLSQLSELGHLSKGTLSGYFRGKGSLTLESLEKISVVLNIMPHLFIKSGQVWNTGLRKKRWGRGWEALDIGKALDAKDDLNDHCVGNLVVKGRASCEVTWHKRRSLS
jgi:transcriptional regulator with XRE-family HTH domain